MRPLRLAIEGFTAFRDRQEVDFEPLDLFVITGPTGAGKTSILDAMIFALYGQVPRLGGKSGTADLISLGRVDARVQLDFAVEGQGRYRVARRLSRKAAQSATLERLEGDDWVPATERGGVRECDRVLRELVGLDFDSFCKAVVLPQGEFHRFLKGDPAERRQVLVSLLGVSYFQRMAEIARHRRTTLAVGVERTEEILADQYADATPERVAQLQVEAGRAADRFAALSEALVAAEQGERAVARHDERLRKLTERKSELGGLGTDLRGKVASCRAAEDERAAAATALDAAASELALHRRTADEAHASVIALEGEHGTADRLAAVGAAAETAAAAAAEEVDARRHLGDAEEAQARAARTLDESISTEDAAKLEATAARAAEEQQAEASRRLGSRQQELHQALAEAERRAAELARARELVAPARAAAETARAAAAGRRAALDEAVRHLEEHRHANAVAELAGGLGAGDPCPVCAVPLSAAVAVEPDVVETLAPARAAESGARAAAEQADAHAVRADTEARSADERALTAERALADAIAGHDGLTALADEAAGAEAVASTAEAGLAERRAERKTLEAAEQHARERVIEARGARQAAAGTVEAATRALSGIETRRVRAAETLTTYFGDPVPDDAGERVAAAQARLTAARTASRAARGELDRVRSAHDEARARADSAQRDLGRLDVELTRLRTRTETASAGLTSALGAEAATAVAEIPTIDGTRDATTSALAEWCATAADAMRTARDATAAARDAAGARLLAIAASHGIEAPSSERAVGLLRQAERAAGDAVVQAQDDVRDAQRRADERAAMEARIAGERVQVAVLGDLALELRADRFGEYIVQETLDVLAAGASEELMRISGDRYSLVPIEGDFHVVDHANADERRSVKTLSGGETFLASLALALALSRHVGELATEGLGAKLEAVFIDEGFGTLDPETLEEVIDALERLREEDLVVGVISHVPALAERVRAGLEVQKHEGRSRIVQTGGGGS